MSTKLKGVVQYVLLVLAAAALLWLSLGSIEVVEGETKLGFILKVGRTANVPYLIISGGLAILSHFIRAERWKLLLEPLGNTPSSMNSFLSVMIGYFVNLAIPRGGEVSRCFNLYKLEKVPFDISFGTVVAERIIDLIFLLTLIGLAFVIELDSLLYFFRQIDFSKGASSNVMVGNLMIVLIVALILVMLTGFLLFKYKNYWSKRVYLKIRKIIDGMKSGLTVVFRLEDRNLFIVYSVLIWVLYFFMSYFVILAFPETQDLGIISALSIFAIGGIAMAIPLPGGTGSYHVLVPLGLSLLFGIKQEEAIAFSFIFHGWQTLIIIIFGLLSLIMSQTLIRRKKYA